MSAICTPHTGLALVLTLLCSAWINGAFTTHTPPYQTRPTRATHKPVLLLAGKPRRPAQSHKTSSSTMPKAAPGVRGQFSSGRSAAPSDAGNILGAMVRPSDTGSSRLWNWLQKVDTPTSVETRPETIQQSVSQCT